MLEEQDIKAIGVVIHKEIIASEERLRGELVQSEGRLTEKLEDKITKSEIRITSKFRAELAEVIDTMIMPQFVEIQGQFREMNERMENLDFSMRDGWRRVDRKFDDLIEVLCQEKVMPNSAAALLERSRIAR